MATIKQLSEADIVENGDQFPFFSEAQGDTRKVTFATLKDSVATDFVSTAELAAQTGAGLVGTSDGTTVQQALDARPTTSALALSTASAGIGFVGPGAGATARTVQAKLRDTVSVKDFGAVGDGVTDDTAAIQAAIDYAFALNGADVFFPAGNYRCGVLTMRQNVSLRGMAAIQGGATRITCTGTHAFRTLATPSFHFFNLYNMEILGTRAVTDFIDQSLGGSWAYSTIEGCYFVNFRHHDILSTGNRWRDNNWQNAAWCRFRGADFTIADNYFGYDDQDTTRTGVDEFVAIHAATGVEFRGNYITSMKPSANPPIPLSVQASSEDVRVLSNWIDGGEIYCAQVIGGARRVLFHANRFAEIYPATCIPIILNNVTDVTVNENLFSGLPPSAPFITFTGPLERCEVHRNLVNSRTDSTIHDYASATIAQAVKMSGYGLAVRNFSGNGDIVPALYGRTITNQGSTGTITLFAYPSRFLAGDFFDFTRTDTTRRLIIRNGDTSAAIYDSDTAGYNRGRVFSYANGSFAVEQR